MSGELALSIQSADGSIKRWGPDEPDAANIPDDLTFSTSMPGGDKDCTCSLLRRIDLDYSDQGLFDQVRVYGPGNETAWQGRMVQFPRDHGDSFGIAPAAVGLSAHLKDDPAFREIYVDRDLSGWRSASVSRRISVAGANTLTDPSVAPDTSSGSPALHLAVRGPWASTAVPVGEAWYDAAPIDIGSIYYAWHRGSSLVSSTGWAWKVLLAPQDNTDTPRDDSGTLAAAGPGTGTLTASTSGRTFGVVQMYYNTGGGVDGEEYAIDWTCLAVYGNHGLTKRGTGDAINAPGFYASDIIADIVSRAAPLLTFTTGVDGSIEPTTFVIPHMTFTDPVTAEDAILTVNAYHLYDWGVYDGEFFYRQPDPARLTWQARLSDGAKLSLEGDTAEQVYNGVFVTYNDFSGTRRTVGPPGAVADATNSALADTSSDNPVNAHSIPRRWGILNLSIPTDEAGATQLGYVWLQERSLATRRGQVTLTGTVAHPTEGEVPVWRVRAGDWISIADHPASLPRKIIETSYSHGSRSITCSVDNTSAKLDSILERLGVFSIGRF